MRNCSPWVSHVAQLLKLPKRESKGTGIRLKNPNVLAFEKELTTLLGLKMQILSHDQSGILLIKYIALEQVLSNCVMRDMSL